MNKKKKSAELIQSSSKRLIRGTKNGYRYPRLNKATSNFSLRRYISKQIPMFVIFVDLVGSTKMSQEIPPDMLGHVIRSFSQEVTIIIENFHGHVLKFVGDAVVGYFIPINNSRKIANDVIECTHAIVDVAKYSANPILRELGLPSLHMHMGADYGKCHVLLYGTDRKKSHIDLIGNSVNLAAKMQGIAKSDELVLGHEIYKKLKNKKNISKISMKTGWKYDYDVYCINFSR